jgi:hypothetical protein
MAVFPSGMGRRNGVDQGRFGPTKPEASATVKEAGGTPALFNLDGVAHHPQLKLLKPSLPTELELLHPVAGLIGIWHIHNNLHEIVPVDYAAVPPMPFHFLRLVTYCTEMIYHFKNRIGEPLRWHITTVIELERKQHLESPPLAVHRSFFP